MTKGLDLPPLPRNTVMASAGNEDGFGGDQFAADHSLYVIHSVSDISYGTGLSIRFSRVSDSIDSTGNSFGPGKILINNFNGMS
jgi:hypothetical protein